MVSPSDKDINIMINVSLQVHVYGTFTTPVSVLVSQETRRSINITLTYVAHCDVTVLKGLWLGPG